jgi:Reverse transcriptase (RNA-dependent DNA polymerase).
MLFNLVMEYVIRKVKADRNATLQYKPIQTVRYADDTCITGRMMEAMKQTYEQLKRQPDVRLSLNVNKTKIMVQYRYDTHTGKEIKLGGDKNEVAYEFIYLGTCNTIHRDELNRYRGQDWSTTHITPYSQ